MAASRYYNAQTFRSDPSHARTLNISVSQTLCEPRVEPCLNHVGIHSNFLNQYDTADGKGLQRPMRANPANLLQTLGVGDDSTLMRSTLTDQ